MDVTPTILGLLGIEAPKGLDGVSLDLLWRNPGTLPEKRILFSEADHNNARPDMGRSIRLDRHKLILNRMNGRSVLFDLEMDPKETSDRAEKEPKVVEALRAALDAFMAGELRGGMIEDPDDELSEKLRAVGY